MEKSEYITIPQLARILGLSRVAVYKKVKKGQIKAVRIGRTFAIPRKYVASILGKALAQEDKKQIDDAVKKTVKEYGQTLKLLGKE
ncbi:MAG: helix-turn-helix domain-containing protein [Planctomycetota bacterium]|jgi:excisionase family DNA binding protein